MYLYVSELRANPLSQQITIGSKHLNVVAIRPHLYRHMMPAGGLALNILDANGNICIQSETINIDQLGTLDYFHGYIRFYVNFMFKAGGVYYIQLVGKNGYTYADNAYVGIVNDYDLRKVTATYTPNTFAKAAFDIELWERRNITRRTG